MKYFSEILGKTFDSEESCLNAESAFKAEQDKVKANEDRIQELRKMYNDTYKEYKEEVAKLEKEYLSDLADLKDGYSKELDEIRKEIAELRKTTNGATTMQKKELSDKEAEEELVKVLKNILNFF